MVIEAEEVEVSGIAIVFGMPVYGDNGNEMYVDRNYIDEDDYFDASLIYNIGDIVKDVNSECYCSLSVTMTVPVSPSGATSR